LNEQAETFQFISGWGVFLFSCKEKQRQEERFQENKKRILSSFFMKQASLTEESLECPFF
jgi:hypothetical protein